MAFALAYFSLIAAHFLIVVHFDLALVYLRIALVAAPFIFGLLYRQPKRNGLSAALLLGLVIGAASVFSMTAVVSKIDQVPYWPVNSFELRELFYYWASIVFGFFAGALLRSRSSI